MLRHALWAALLLLCVVGCVGPWAATRAPAPRPVVPSRAAIATEDGQIFVQTLGSADRQRVGQVTALTPGQALNGQEATIPCWPTWSPDASQVAFFRVLLTPAQDLLGAQLWIVSYDGTGLKLLWEAADYEPIYAAWSPNGAMIALLAQGLEDIELILLDPKGTQPPRTVAQGVPLYFTWSADSREMLLHVGSPRTGPGRGELVLVHLGPPDQLRAFGTTPGNFRVPAWSADGERIAYVADDPAGAGTLSIASPHGGDVTKLGVVKRETAFALSDDGTRLAWSSRSEVDRLAYDGLEVVKADGSSRVRVTADLVVAFFWSPDNQQLAFVTIDPLEQAFGWNVADASGENPRRLGTFTPSQEQFRMLAFFDQYALSHGLWAPDSSGLVYAASSSADTQRVFGSTSRGRIVVLPTDGSGPAKILAEGGFVAMPVAAPAQ